MKKQYEYVIKYLKECMEHEGYYFNLGIFAKEVSYEKCDWFDYLEPIMINCKIFKIYDSVYELRRQLLSDAKTKMKFIDYRLNGDFIRRFKSIEIENNTDSSNLLSSLMELVKQRVKEIILDIDEDVLEYVQREVIQIMENENE